MFKKDEISTISSGNVRQAEKAGFQVAIVQTLVNDSLTCLAKSCHADLAFKTTCRTWGQLFHLPNPFLVQQRVVFRVHTSNTINLVS